MGVNLQNYDIGVALQAVIFNRWIHRTACYKVALVLGLGPTRLLGQWLTRETMTASASFKWVPPNQTPSKRLSIGWAFSPFSFTIFEVKAVLKCHVSIIPSKIHYSNFRTSKEFNSSKFIKHGILKKIMWQISIVSLTVISLTLQ